MFFEPLFASLGPLGSAAVLLLLLSVPSAVGVAEMMRAARRDQAR